MVGLEFMLGMGMYWATLILLSFLLMRQKWWKCCCILLDRKCSNYKCGMTSLWFYVNNSGAVPNTNNKYGSGTVPTVLTSFRCSGSEQRLLDCPYLYNQGRSCNKAAVECREGELIFPCNSYTY